MSLYRQYRPQSFADVSGQEHIVTTLERAVAQDKLSHAYLFAGPRGTGKTSLARILAKHMLTKGMEEKAAQEAMKEVEEGTAVDLIEIDAASNRGIDDVRELIERIQFSPIRATAKVYIIDEVHMLTREAFNALLKTLEEPPSYAYFILATTELHKIPATIQSRCQRFLFTHVSEEDIIRRLQFIADQEHITIDRTALRTIAGHADGGVRDAIALLDQLRSLAKITTEDVEERAGHSGKQLAMELYASLTEKNESGVLDAIRRAEETGMSLENVTRELLGLIRASLHNAAAQNQPLGAYIRMTEELLEAVKDLRIAPVPALALEASLLTLLRDPSEVRAAPAPKREEAPTRSEPKVEVKTKPFAAKEISPEPEAKREPIETPQEKAEVAPTLVEAPVVSLEEMNSHWQEIVEKTKPASAKMSLKNGRVVSISGMKVTVAFSARFHCERVSEKEALHNIEDVLREIFRQPLRLSCILEQDRGIPASSEEVSLADIAAEVF